MQKTPNAFRLFCLPIACAAALFFPFPLFAQNPPARAASQQNGQESLQDEGMGQGETSRHDILNYALDSEIIELIGELIAEKNAEYNDELYSLFLRTRNDSLKESIFRFFAEQKNPILEDECATILDDPYEAKRSLLSAAISYAGEAGLANLLPQLRSLAESGNYDFASPAVKVISKIGSSGDAAFLINLMEEDFFDDEKQRLVFRQDIMGAIASLDCSEIRGQLAEIAGSAEENAVIRAGAALALAALKNANDIDAIAALFGESDPILRTASVSALSNFSSSQTAKDVVLEAFKDSYYKVREEALSAAEKMNLGEAVPYILYRAKTDPAESVKLKSYEALGKLGNEEGRKFLTEILKDEKQAGKMRVKAADVLLKYHFDSSYSDVAEVAASAVSDSKQSWICHELGKIIAGIETESSANLAVAYLASSDAVAQSLGLDMYEKNRYASVRGKVEELAANKSAGALQRRAEKLLDTQQQQGEEAPPQAQARRANPQGAQGQQARPQGQERRSRPQSRQEP